MLGDAGAWPSMAGALDGRQRGQTTALADSNVVVPCVRVHILVANCWHETRPLADELVSSLITRSASLEIFLMALRFSTRNPLPALGAARQCFRPKRLGLKLGGLAALLGVDASLACLTAGA